MYSIRDKLRDLVRPRDDPDAYEPLPNTGDEADGGDDGQHTVDARRVKCRFSWIEYSIYFLMGIAMLWAWNMFLAAGPYLQRRFKDSQSILDNFQSAELVISTVASLGSMLILTKLQARANYPHRIINALVLYMASFTILALSARTFLGVSAGTYFGFIICMVFITSLATGIFQNGAFAFVAGAGREEYMQAMMTGQGVAGVLPPIVQVISVLSVSEAKRHSTVVAPRESSASAAPVAQESSTAAFVYFLTATGVSTITLLAYALLLSRHNSRLRRTHPDPSSTSTDPNNASSARKSIPILPLLLTLRFYALAIFLTFVVTMFFPVFTQKIISVHTPTPGTHHSPYAPSTSRWYTPEVFIPTSFFFWNLGDLLGRIAPAWHRVNITHRPKSLLAISVLRVLFIPAYFLCNISGAGLVVLPDGAYWLLQSLFGLSNGFVGSSCMMGFGSVVAEEEMEAAGSLMSLLLVAGLGVGSVLSFAVKV